MRGLSSVLLSSIAVLALSLYPLPVYSQSDQAALVDKLANGVYLFVWGGTKSLFVITEEGVIVTDPQEESLAKRYLKEIRKLTDKPVKYIIYSHRHGDHIAGGRVFPGYPIIVSHENARRRLIKQGNPDVVIPSLTFSQELTIHLGKKRVKVLYLGHSETNDNCFIYLPEEKILFAVDSIGNRSVAWGHMRDANAQEWAQALKRVEKLDFNILALSHGELGTKETVREFREYLSDLISEVKKYVDRGISLEETQEKISLPKYETWRHYDVHFRLNVLKVYMELADN